MDNQNNEGGAEFKASKDEVEKGETLAREIADSERETIENMGRALISLELEMKPHGLSVVELLRTVAAKLHGVHFNAPN